MDHFPRTLEGGPPLIEEEILSFESRHGLSLPRSYRQFLLATNGGRPERDLFPISGLDANTHGRIHVFFGLNDPVDSCNLDWNLKVFSERLPARMLPIATTEGVDKVCMLMEGEQAGAIFYWDGYAQAGERDLYFLASTFESFMSALGSDELSPRVPEP